MGRMWEKLGEGWVVGVHVGEVRERVDSRGACVRS